MNEAPTSNGTASNLTLQVYLLGQVEFEAALAFQRRLVYDVAGQRSHAALILCEHPPLITVGRSGSWAHIRFDTEELDLRRWRLRWVNRGGGCLLHLPGQLAVYPILPLDHLGIGLHGYIDRLHQVVSRLLADFSVRSETAPSHPGLLVRDRLIAGIGVAVRHWVSYYGAYVNICPDLEPFRRIRCHADDHHPMTSLARERRGLLHGSLVRQRFLEHFAEWFPFAQTSLFFDHPMLTKKTASNAIATRY